jgi:hypothetical protein
VVRRRQDFSILWNGSMAQRLPYKAMISFSDKVVSVDTSAIHLFRLCLSRTNTIFAGIDSGKASWRT